MQIYQSGLCRFIFLFIFAVVTLSLMQAADVPTVALSDLSVNSTNPKYTFLGKGFAEIVAFELKKAPNLKLVDRAKRNDILKEMEFALSGIADEQNQMQIGRLLAVHYLIGGSITDLGDSLLVSLSMVDVETGEIAWNDQIQESSGKYSYIGAYFAASLFKYFNVQADKSMEAELATKVEKDAASVVALSEGIAALDEGNNDKARMKLEEAKKIDPGNAVASAFLSMLASASAKFKVLPERYVSYYNPAYLSWLEGDKLFYSYNQGWITYGTNDTNNQQLISIDETTEWGSGERRKGNIIGYQFPITPSFGIGIESMATTLEDSVVQKTVFDVYAQDGNQNTDFNKYILSAGFAFNPQLSFGLGLQLEQYDRSYFELSWGSNEYREQYDWAFGGIVSAVVKNSSGNLVWDIVGSYSTEQLYYFDNAPAVDTFVAYNSPIYVEQTLAWAQNNQNTFLALKQANDIYFDRALYYGRLMPCFEQWFWKLFSLRIGAEGALVAKNGSMSLGWGGTAGVTIKIWKFELDANYTFRQRPSRSLADVMIPESVFFVTLSVNDLITALIPE